MPEQAVAKSLSLAIKRSGNTAVVHCHGRLVAGVTGYFYREVSPLIPDRKRIALDFAELSHMDSSGIGTLVRLYVSAKSGGCTLQLMNVGKPVRCLLGITHLMSLLQIIGENNIRMGP